METNAIKSRTLVLSHQIPATRMKKYWEGLRDGKVFATSCKKCKSLYYPPQADCPKCLTSDMEWTDVGTEGVVLAFTESHIIPQGFTHYRSPYTITIVGVEKGLKIMGWMDDTAGGQRVAVGRKVRISTRIQSDGYPVILFSPIP